MTTVPIAARRCGTDLMSGSRRPWSGGVSTAFECGRVQPHPARGDPQGAVGNAQTETREIDGRVVRGGGRTLAEVGRGVDIDPGVARTDRTALSGRHVDGAVGIGSALERATVTVINLHAAVVKLADGVFGYQAVQDRRLDRPRTIRVIDLVIVDVPHRFEGRGVRCRFTRRCRSRRGTRLAVAERTVD